MAGNPQVLGLLEEMLDSGKTPEEVCRGCPELLAGVRERWREFRLIDAAVSCPRQLHNLTVRSACEIGSHHLTILWMQRTSDQYSCSLRQDTFGHQHRLGSRRSAIVHARVRHIQPKQRRD